MWAGEHFVRCYFEVDAYVGWCVYSCVGGWMRVLVGVDGRGGGGGWWPARRPRHSLRRKRRSRPPGPRPLRPPSVLPRPWHLQLHRPPQLHLCLHCWRLHLCMRLRLHRCPSAVTDHCRRRRWRRHGSRVRGVWGWAGGAAKEGVKAGGHPGKRASERADKQASGQGRDGRDRREGREGR